MLSELGQIQPTICHRLDLVATKPFYFSSIDALCCH